MCFFALGDPNPLESLERRLSEIRKINLGRNFSSFPAERERRATPGAAPRGRIGGSMARRNRRVEPDGGPAVKPNGAQGGAQDGRPAAAGRKAGRVPPVSSFAFFGASTGRGRRTSGVDGADIGRGIHHVKANYRKKGNNFERALPPQSPLPPRTERSGDPGTRATGKGLSSRPWAPDQVRGGKLGWEFGGSDRGAETFDSSYPSPSSEGEARWGCGGAGTAYRHRTPIDLAALGHFPL